MPASQSSEQEVHTIHIGASAAVGTQFVFSSTSRCTGPLRPNNCSSSLDFCLISKYFYSPLYVAGLVHQGPNRNKIWFISSRAISCWNQELIKCRRTMWEVLWAQRESRRGLPETSWGRGGEGRRWCSWGKGLEGCWSWEKGVLGREEQRKAYIGALLWAQR